MSEIEFLLPTVQYGNIKVRATPEELGIASAADAAAIGTAYIVYLNALKQGIERGARIDVTIDDSAPEPEQMIKDELGGVVVGEELIPPWEYEVEAQPKPWEAGAKPAPAAAVINW